MSSVRDLNNNVLAVSEWCIMRYIQGTIQAWILLLLLIKLSLLLLLLVHMQLRVVGIIWTYWSTNGVIISSLIKRRLLLLLLLLKLHCLLCLLIAPVRVVSFLRASPSIRFILQWSLSTWRIIIHSSIRIMIMNVLNIIIEL